MINKLLEGNRRFVTDVFEKNRDHYDMLCEAQHPTVLWIGCADSRVAVDHITSTLPGTIFVHRNVANIVSFNDNNFGAVLAFALHHLRIHEIVVCGHYFCGGLGALVNGSDMHVIQDWLNIAGVALTKVDEVDPDHRLSDVRRMELLTQFHVLSQIEHLEQFALVRDARKRDPSLRIAGLIYDFRTGRLEQVPDDPGKDAFADVGK